MDPSHSLPVQEAHLASGVHSSIDSHQNNTTSADIKRQLALKEQDLLYAKQRAEKAMQEAERSRKEL